MSYIVTYCDVLTQLLHKVLLYTIQHTTYLLPRELLSRPSRSMWIKHPTNHSYCTWPLRCDSSEPNATLSHTNWLIGFVMRTAPPVSLQRLRFPLRAFKPSFFPLHQLCCYIHRSYQWTLCRHSEQACLNGPLLARACRTLPCWVSRDTYPSINGKPSIRRLNSP